MSNSYILAIDQGTSSTKTIIFDEQARVVAKATEPLKTFYYDGGYVEQNPEEIFSNVLASIKNCIAQFEEGGHQIAAIKTCGISNQRETFVIWDESGKPLHNAVVWQCKRSVGVCKNLIARGLEEEVRTVTGLTIDPYFSGSKLIWLCENIPEIRAAVDGGRAYFGTVDTWLLYKLTNGEKYLTDYTNASRTLFFNLSTLQWDTALLEKFGLSNLRLPGVMPSSGSFGATDFNGILSEPLPIAGMIGDSHAAAFGEGCFTAGTAKATLGTGCSVLMNIGKKAAPATNGMMTTICWSTEQEVNYAFEGVIVSCGATIEWLKDELGIITHVNQTEAMARAADGNHGVYLVPAFSGMGAPYWDMERRASITGLTFDCNRNHVVRAALESIAYQVKDVIDAMQGGAGIRLDELMVHGGLTSNQFVVQFLADLAGCKVLRSEMPDASALGAALLAGLKAGVFKDLSEIKALHFSKSAVEKGNYRSNMAENYEGWKLAIGAGSKG